MAITAEALEKNNGNEVQAGQEDKDAQEEEEEAAAEEEEEEEAAAAAAEKAKGRETGRMG